MFSRSLLPLPPSQIARLSAVRMPAAAGVGALTSKFLMQLANTIDDCSPTEAVRLSTSALEILATRLARELDVSGCVAPETHRRALVTGIRAFIDKIDPLSPGDFIGRWMAMFIKPGEIVEQRERETMQDFVVRIEKAAIFRSLENLMTFPFVRSAVESGATLLHGAYFGVAEGSLFVLDKATKEFKSAREA